MCKIISAVICVAMISIATGSTHAVQIPTVSVGNAGNSPDPLVSFNNPDNLLFGSVDYEYQIGMTEVTNAQYVEFLNAKAASDSLGLYNTSMGSQSRGGIARNGVAGSYTYAAKSNMEDKPVNYVSWYDAVRFANWLNNGQGSGDTETGAYTLLGGTPTPSNGMNIARSSGATWFLPSENEWYKAAYHQPSAHGGDTDDYWHYPTASNAESLPATATSAGDIGNPGNNVANYNQSADWNNLDGNVTTVGSAGLLSQSFYGTSDQGGNVSEWNESLLVGSFGSFRGLRGGEWAYISLGLTSTFRNGTGPSDEFAYFGFRVATIPEPSTSILAILGMVMFASVYKRVKGSEG